MSRIRTGHGPDDWLVLEPARAERTPSRYRTVGGALVQARQPTPLMINTPAAAARQARRNAEQRAARRAGA